MKVSDARARPVLLITPWYGGNEGGVAVATSSLAGALTRIGTRVLVLHFDTDRRWPTVEVGPHGEDVISVGLPVLDGRYRTLRSAVGYLIRRLAIWRAVHIVCHRFGARVAHIHYCIGEYDQVLPFLSRMAVPIVTTFHGSEINVYFDDDRVGPVVRSMIRASVRLTAVSSRLAETALAHSPEAAPKLRVVRNGVPLDVWDMTSDRAQAAIDLAEEEATGDIIFVGNLLPIKGPDLLIDAFKILVRARPGATLEIVGDGPMEAQLRRAVSVGGLSQLVRFSGRLSRAEIIRKVGAAKIVAIPSRNEGLSLVALEAQLIGIPVVAMNVGGLPEAVVSGETGLIVEAGDVTAFAAAVLDLLEDGDKWKRYSKAARSFARTRFDPHVVAQSYAQLYIEAELELGSQNRGRKRRLNRMLKRVTRVFSPGVGSLALPAPLRRQILLDHSGLPNTCPDVEEAIRACLGWLCRAQDMSTSADGGVARHFSFLDGWGASYPETTGYIIPTFLEQARRGRGSDLQQRAERMLRWLSSIQLSNGAFQGGAVGAVPIAPVHFNTGQILLGLAEGQRAFGTYGAQLRSAADWLVSVQEADGCWRKFQSPFVIQGDKTYYTHVAWGLLEAERVDPGRGYAEAAMANIRWALDQQTESGWFRNCCLTDYSKPLTHTIGYTLRGIIEGYLYSLDPQLLSAAMLAADGLETALDEAGFLPGCLAQDWSAAANWACLTGTAQVAHCWLLLFQVTNLRRYLDAGRRANAYVRHTVSVSGSPDIIGGVRGSFPIDGEYCRYAYPNWAAKFLIDSLSLELDLTRSGEIAAA